METEEAQRLLISRRRRAFVASSHPQPETAVWIAACDHFVVLTYRRGAFHICSPYQPIIQNGPPAAELRLASFKMIDRSHV